MEEVKYTLCVIHLKLLLIMCDNDDDKVCVLTSVCNEF